MKRLLAALTIITLAGCDSTERNFILIDPVDGCRYVASSYGDSVMAPNSSVKPQVDASGKKLCIKGGGFTM